MYFGGQLSLRISPERKWILSKDIVVQPQVHMGIRPYGLLHQPDFCPSTSLRQLSQTHISIKNNKWFLSVFPPLSMQGFHYRLLCLPAELRYQIYGMLLPSSTRVNKSGICLPVQVVVNSQGQLDIRSLKKRSPDIYRCLPLLNAPFLAREFGELFWGRHEIIVNYKGLASFLKGPAGRWVKSLKIVIGVWDLNKKQKWKEEERYLADQLNTLLQRQFKLERVGIVVCIWKFRLVPYHERIPHKKFGHQIHFLCEESCLEQNHKWKALAEPLVKLRQKSLLNSLVLRSYAVRIPRRSKKICPFCEQKGVVRNTNIANEQYDSSAEKWELSKAETEGPSVIGNIDQNNWIVTPFPSSSEVKVSDWPFEQQEAPGYEPWFSYFSKNILYWLDEAVAIYKGSGQTHENTYRTVYYPQCFAYSERNFKFCVRKILCREWVWEIDELDMPKLTRVVIKQGNHQIAVLSRVTYP